MQVGVPGIGTGEPRGSPHGPPIRLAMRRTKKYRTDGGSSAYAPRRQSRIAGVQRRADNKSQKGDCQFHTAGVGCGWRRATQTFITGGKMDTAAQKKYGPLVGLGLMFIWGSAALFFVGIPNGAIAWGGIALTGVCAVAVFLYVGRIENELHRLFKSEAMYRADAEQWKEQAQTAIEMVKTSSRV